MSLAKKNAWNFRNKYIYHKNPLKKIKAVEMLLYSTSFDFIIKVGRGQSPADAYSDWSPSPLCLSSAGLQTPPPPPNLMGLLAGDITERNHHQQLHIPSALSASAPPPWPLPLLTLFLLLLWTQLLPLWVEPLAGSHTSAQMSYSIFRLW